MEFTFITHAGATTYLFPGQGSQQVGMGQDLVAAYPVARHTFEEADDLLGFSLSGLCFYGPETELTATINAQPALLTMSVALLRALEQEFGGSAAVQSTSLGATLVAGHSLGEYTALVASGSLGFADGVRLVRERGWLMKEASERSPGLMAAILGLEEENVARICVEATRHGGIAQVANDNCPGQLVISGDQLGMEAAMVALGAAGAKKIVPLAVSIASHCPLMEPAAVALRQLIGATPLQAPLVPLIANTSAQPITDVTAIRAELAAQLTGSVRWNASMQYALQQGVTNFVEIGPGDVLSGILRRIDRNAQRHTVSSVEGIQAFVQKTIL